MREPLEMRTFVRAAERTSFSTAASDLGLTPSAVSKIVSRLEERLGVRLFTRSTRRLALTPEGDTFFARARRILDDIDEAEAEAALSRAVPRGKLRVNTGSSFCFHQLTPVMPEFLARYPEVSVDLSVTDRVIDLHDENADVAIRVGKIGENIPYVARKIVDMERVICASPDYLARRGTPTRPEHLHDHDCIAVSISGLHRWPMRAPDGGIEMLDIKAKIIADDAEAILRLAVGGAGIVRLGDNIVGGALHRGELVPLLKEHHVVEPLPLSLVYIAGRHRLPKVSVFIAFIMEKFASAPWRVGK